MEIEKKNVKWLVVIIILLILIILGLVGYIVYEEVSEMQNDNITENKNNDKQDKDLTVDSELVQELMKDFKLIYIPEADLYGESKYNVSQLSDEELILTAINNIDSKYITYCIADVADLKNELSMDILNNSLNSLVRDKSITLDMIMALDNEVTSTIAQYAVGAIGIIINDNDTINLVGPCHGEYGPQDFISEKLIDVKQDGEYLYIYTKEAFGHYDFESNNDVLLVNFYKEYSNTTVLEKGFVDDELKFDDNGVNQSINWDLYDTYKYTFKKVNDKYYFESFGLNQ